jgi:hypothetical protein
MIYAVMRSDVIADDYIFFNLNNNLVKNKSFFFYLLMKKYQTIPMKK